MAWQQVRGDVVINTASGPNLIVWTWLEDANGDILDATACTIIVYDHTGTSVVANADWNTAPTETALLTWYAVLTNSATVLTAGKGYLVKVTFTVAAVAYPKWFSFSAPN